MTLLQIAREHLGVLLKDRPRYAPALSESAADRHGDSLWVHLSNRHEVLEVNASGPGVRCTWPGSSKLHACGLRPDWGCRLMKRAFEDWPIAFADMPVSADGPSVSFVFAHAGTDRLPLLAQTIRAVFAQKEVAVEVIVVDQSPAPMPDAIPEAVRYIHLDKTDMSPGWRKSWAFNVGARAANSDVLIFHDGDILPPEGYAAEVAAHLGTAYEAAVIQRFLFYLTESATQRLTESDAVTASSPETVLQNWTGGTIAITKEAFFGIGGFDEGFVDWGGEDGEFYDRCRSLALMDFGYIPFVHLWHVPQVGRKDAANVSVAEILPQLLEQERSQRVTRLCGRDYGNPRQTDPIESYRSTGVPA